MPQDSQQSGGGRRRRRRLPRWRGRRGGGGGYHHGGGTMLYDSILLASDELMKKQKGRKAVIVLTDGVDRGSKVSITEAIESAQRSDTLVYSIYFTCNEGLSRASGIRTAAAWAGGTGGGDTRQENRPDGKKSTPADFQRRPAAATSKSLISRRSIRSTSGYRKSCATSTASGTRRTSRSRKAATGG